MAEARPKQNPVEEAMSIVQERFLLILVKA
jgi:hypothetical protein